MQLNFCTLREHKPGQANEEGVHNKVSKIFGSNLQEIVNYIA